MSTLEKAMELLQTIPENRLETVYTFLQFVKLQEDEQGTTSAFGIAHKYADPNLVSKEKEAFANAMAEKHAIDTNP